MHKFNYALRDFIRQAIQNNYGLLACTILAFWAANSSMQSSYLVLQHTLHFPVNDIAMSLFFFLIGLELKREWFIGELRHPHTRTLPAIAALGGMIFPAIIFLMFNYHDPLTKHAAAIPMATDIAFALGALQLLGNRIPHSAKIFLLSLAVFDDIGAIIIIAIFYSPKLWFSGFLLTALCFYLFLLFKKRRMPLFLYLLNGCILWYSIWKIGIHPTLAGVITGLFIPFENTEQKNSFFYLEKNLHTLVSLIILPLFALVNAGFIWPSLAILQDHLHLMSGIVFGLMLGKPIGIVGSVFLFLTLTKKSLPHSLSYFDLIGISFLAGIGFTMSLFIGTLSFEFSPILLDNTRMAILMGSLFSATIGIISLLMARNHKRNL